MRALYSALLYLLAPFVLLRLLWRGFRLHDYWHRWNERFGFVPRPAQPAAVWLHAVSVGEVQAAAPLVKHLVARHGRGRVWVTTLTPTGSARARAAFGDEVRHSYVPYDLPDAVARFLARLRPQRAVVMETELWPNLFAACVRRGIPLVIANARLSPRSFAGYRRLGCFVTRTLACANVIAAQSALDAERFRALGAEPARVHVTGNLKFDVEAPAAQVEAGRVLLENPGLGTRDSGLGNKRPVWIAASTHEGEEDAVLHAHAQVLDRFPGTVLIVVPRHPQRFDAVEKLITRSGFTCIRRSELPSTSPESRVPSPVLLGDTLGEMFMYLAAADVAFVGGSLVPVGGHNVLEPAALGLSVLFGPHMHNFLEARSALLARGAALEITDADALGAQVASLLADPARRAAMGAAGRQAMQENRGVVEALLSLIERSAQNEKTSFF